METRYPELAEDVLMIRCCLKTWTENIIVARKEFIAKQVKGSDSWLKISLGLIQIALENVRFPIFLLNIKLCSTRQLIIII